MQEKIEIIAKEIYGAAAVEFLPRAEEQLEAFTRMGFAKLPICMAKTQYSFSADPSAKGVPTGFVLPIRDVQVCCFPSSSLLAFAHCFQASVQIAFWADVHPP